MEHKSLSQSSEQSGVWHGLLLAANYIFYLLIQARYIGLLIFCTLVSFFCAQILHRYTDRKRTIWLAVGQICIFGVLFFYKYLGFFSSIILEPLGYTDISSATDATPVGLSFFTFAASGYLFDVYRHKCPVEKNVVNYSAFLSFFPAVLSGPIGRARDFLPQLKRRERWSILGFRHGLLRVVTGGIKKWVLADNLGILVNTVYGNTTACSSGQILAAVIAYALQIYIDFSAYSDMALGMSEILGFHLTENFHAPYCSRTVKSFWKKWHISLTDWFREYLYFPLGGSRQGKVRQYCNILIVFAVSGLWHGAAWTFLIWGLLNGFMQVMGAVLQPFRTRLWNRLPISKDSTIHIIWQGLFTFGLTAVSWVFFRAESLRQAFYILRRLGGIIRYGFGNQSILLLGIGKRQVLLTALGLLAVFAADLRKTAAAKPFPLEKHPILFYFSLTVLLLFLAVFGNYGPEFHASTYIYFQF